ncbi:DUF4136 domain-containing protein [uncultured Christiangramia sp.]|uniref:DUF4136 domain-containing protein n=1 Tax=Christiangramia sp. 3-2217-3z TaxID=3417564 RepID=UPI00260E276E|nr:DUF4136 domain-containing protein [uncultured Christiangramia sp.]
MKILKISTLLLFMAACNTPQAVYDYDQTVQFDQYNSYSIYSDLQTGLNQLDQGRLLNAVNSKMQEKGFSRSQTAGLQVNVYTQEYERDNRSRVGLGLGGGGGNVGVGVSGGIPIGKMDTYMKLTFDFIDIEKDALVWQAVVESSFDANADPEKRQKTFDKIVEKALEGYPPQE